MSDVVGVCAVCGRPVTECGGYTCERPRSPHENTGALFGSGLRAGRPDELTLHAALEHAAWLRTQPSSSELTVIGKMAMTLADEVLRLRAVVMSGSGEADADEPHLIDAFAEVAKQLRRLPSHEQRLRVVFAVAALLDLEIQEAR